MKNDNMLLNNELPSIGKLFKSTILAVFVAAVILITVVLPAEYGIDPTGIGNLIGLVKMGEIKVSLAQEAASERAIEKKQKSESGNKLQSATIPVAEDIAPESDVNVKSDQMTITLKQNEGKEIKLTMKKGAKVNYVWWTDKGRANFDVHADSKALEISYHNYEKGSLEKSEGVLEAAFDGSHGWFWRNRTSETMTVTLQVSGNYSEIKQVK